MHWHSKMSTQRRAEVCKMLQNPSAANIHNAGTMLEFRKLSRAHTAPFLEPKQFGTTAITEQMVLTSQFIPVPGVCVVVTRTNAGMVKEQGLGNGNASLLCADTELLQQGRRAQQRSPCDLGAPAQILIPPKARGAGWWQQLPCLSRGAWNKRLEQNDPRWKLLVQFVGWTQLLSNTTVALPGQDSECHSERGKGAFWKKTEEIWSPDRSFERLGRVADASPVIPPAFIFWAVQRLWLISVLPLLQPSHFSWYFRVYHSVLTCLHPLRAFLF